MGTALAARSRGRYQRTLVTLATMSGEISVYDWALRPLLFGIPPAAAHALALSGLGLVEHSAPLRALVRRAANVPTDDRLAVRAMGLTFPSPLGLAGGFDKNARRPRALAALGFGHLELGTVTATAQRENPRPNLFRLPRDHALINRLGFPNDGALEIATRIAPVRSSVPVPIGVSIGKSRVVPVTDLAAVVADYAASFDAVRGTADFVVVNVSSPNTAGLRSMQARDHIRMLLATLRERSDRDERRTPILVKVAPDLSDEELDDVLSAAQETQVAGVVATNTTIARGGLATDAALVKAMGAGGLSGPPLRARALAVVRRARERLGRAAVVVGVGGVENGEHAVALLRAGANLVQMYTGFVYGGPFAPARIAREILRIVDRSGARHVGELVSRDV
jgi:dihydroorotate dehydrogenase